MYPNDQGNPAAAIPVYVVSGTSSSHLDGNAGTLIKAGPGLLGSVAINTAGTATTLTLRDGTDNTGSIIAVIDTGAQGSLQYGIPFTIGLYAVTAGSSPADITIGYA